MDSKESQKALEVCTPKERHRAQASNLVIWADNTWISQVRVLLTFFFLVCFFLEEVFLTWEVDELVGKGPEQQSQEGCYGLCRKKSKNAAVSIYLSLGLEGGRPGPWGHAPKVTHYKVYSTFWLKTATNIYPQHHPQKHPLPFLL